MSNGLEVSEAAYSPTTWQDGVTPVNAVNLNKIESGLQGAALIADQAKAANPPTPVNGKWLTAAGGAMVWADLPAGGGAGLDWEGAWSGATPYVKGDVVTYNGIVYGAVNDSTGQTPPAALGANIPLVTALPGSAGDGQEVILCDSVTAPTFTWRFRYVAAKATNKWVFVGGAPIISEVDASQSTTTNTFTDLGTVGPSLAVPVAGDYIVGLGAIIYCPTDVTTPTMSFQIGAATALDADGISRNSGVFSGTPAIGGSFARQRRKSLLAVTLTAKYHSTSSYSSTFGNRWMSLEPLAVGG